MFAIFEDNYLRTRFIKEVEGNSYAQIELSKKVISIKFEIPISRVVLISGPYEHEDVYSETYSVKISREIK